jgi:DNA-binding NarL/FixJ family response regulator
VPFGVLGKAVPCMSTSATSLWRQPAVSRAARPSPPFCPFAQFSSVARTGDFDPRIGRKGRDGCGYDLGFALPCRCDADGIMGLVLLTVLVVDDDPAFLALASRILGEMGDVKITTTTNAADAAVEAHAKRPQAALVDVGLPDRDGVDLAQELAALPWSPRVVLTSADKDAVSAIVYPEGESALPFLPKEELANGALRSLLLGALMEHPVRVLVGEDDVLLRAGIVRLLAEAGFDVVAQTGDAEDFLRKAVAYQPDVAVVDIQMPPGHGDDGLRAALELRARRPETGVLVLSQYYENQYAVDLIGESAEGVGYLLKERVGDVEALTDAVARVAAGGSALDPEVVGRMLGRRRRGGPLDGLSPRERDVLAQLAEGKSNRGIAEALMVTTAAVEKHVTSIFSKLGLEKSPTGHRRVLAALAYLRESRR